jgi:hypothetical protein
MFARGADQVGAHLDLVDLRRQADISGLAHNRVGGEKADVGLQPRAEQTTDFSTAFTAFTASTASCLAGRGKAGSFDPQKREAASYSTRADSVWPRR